MTGEDRGQRWLSAHLYYHDRLDPLLRDLVAPLVRELAREGLAGAFFYLRYWDGGPHLRLRLQTTAREAVEARLASRYAEFARTRPAPDRMAPAAYRRQAATLARWEQVATYAPVLRPNNSLALVPYEPELLRYGGGTNLAAVEQHFGESSRIALRLICAGAGDAHRRTAAFSMILLAWLAAGARRPAGAGTGPWPPDLGRDPLAERLYQRQAGRLAEIARRLPEVIRDRAATGRPQAGALAEWSRSVVQLRDRLAGSPPPARILDHCAHLICNRLGVEPAEEGQLRYLAARTAGSLTQTGGWRHAVA